MNKQKSLNQNFLEKQTMASFFLYALIFNGIFFGFLTKLNYGTWSSTIIFFSASFTGILLEILKNRINSFFIYSSVLTGLVWYTLFGMSYLAGGTQSVAVWWFGILPLMASLLISSKAAYSWSGVSVLSVILIRLLDYYEFNSNPLDSGEFKNLDYFFNQLGLVLTIAVFGLLSERIRSRYLHQKENLQERAYFNKNLISLGEMCSGLAHEMNNPLTVMKGNIRAIKKEFKNKNVDFDKGLDRVEKIEMMIIRTSKIIDSLRVLSHDGSQDIVEFFPLGLALEEFLAHEEERLQGLGISFKFVADDKVMLTKIKGVQVQLSQVLYNLITNAVDAVLNLNEKWIKLEIKSSSDYLYIQLSNSGPPIPEDILEEIFTPFFTTKEVGKGTGLGLSFCNQVIQRMDGELSLRHDLPYTCFEIKLQLS